MNKFSESPLRGLYNTDTLRYYIIREDHRDGVPEMDKLAVGRLFSGNINFTYEEFNMTYFDTIEECEIVVTSMTQVDKIMKNTDSYTYHICEEKVNRSPISSTGEPPVEDPELDEPPVEDPELDGPQ